MTITKLGAKGTVCDRANLEEPFISFAVGMGGSTGGRVLRERMLLVVTSTEPVRERSYAIELGGKFGNIAWITWTRQLLQEVNKSNLDHCWRDLTTRGLTRVRSGAGSGSSISGGGKEVI
jgi:hypothetical protein